MVKVAMAASVAVMVKEEMPHWMETLQLSSTVTEIISSGSLRIISKNRRAGKMKAPVSLISAGTVTVPGSALTCMMQSREV